MSRRYSLSSKFPLSCFLSVKDDGFYSNVQDDEPCSSSTPLSNTWSGSPNVVSRNTTVAAPETNPTLSQLFPPETATRTHVATLGPIPIPRLVSTGIDPRLFAKNESGKFAVNVFEYSVTFEASPLINTQLENPSYNPMLTARVTYGYWYIFPRYRINFFLSLRSQGLGFHNGLYAVGYMKLIQDCFGDFEPAVHSVGNFHYWRRNTIFGKTIRRGGTSYDGKDVRGDILEASGGEYEVVSSSVPPTRPGRSKRSVQHLKKEGKGKVRCTFKGCKASYASRSSMNDHKSSIHGIGGKNFRCLEWECSRRRKSNTRCTIDCSMDCGRICGEVFPQKNSLIRHICTNHTGAKPYLCKHSDDGCTTASSRNDGLKEHYRLCHNGAQDPTGKKRKKGSSTPVPKSTLPNLSISAPGLSFF